MGADTESQWHQDLLALGLAPREVVGQGIEGVVVALDGERVAKVWRRHGPAELSGRRAFDDALAGLGLPFATPRIFEVLEVDGRAVTVEARLHGTALPGVDESGRLDDAVIGHLVDVLAGLAAAPAPVGADVLPALPGEAPLSGDFGSALAGMVAARTHRDVALHRAVPDLDAWVAATTAGLLELAPAPPRLVHGDLIAPNVLVADHQVSAVLDFGFLTAVGDPAFDAAVTASVMDMYGPRARLHERALDDALAARLPYPPERLALYRATYALLTATVFSTSGSDGHFEWCVRMLTRDDVRAAVR